MFSSTPSFSSSTSAFGSSFGSNVSSTNQFGSRNIFGQSTNNTSTLPFGSQNIFGQSSNTNVSSTTPFGSQHIFGQSGNADTSGSASTGGATFGGGTSMGVFGATAAPFSSNAVLSPIGWGSSSASLSSSTSAFGSLSGFGQNSNTNVSSINPFGSQNVVSQRGNTDTSGSASAGGATFASGTSVSPFGTAAGPFSKPLWVSAAAISTPSQTPAVNASSSPGFGFVCSPTSGQTTVPFGTSTLFGTTTSRFETQTPFSGTQGRISTFGGISSGQSAFGGQCKGSKVATYKRTLLDEGNSITQYASSISAMPVYQDKSHEELRWEDYQFNDGGFGVNPASTMSTNNTFFNPFSTPSSVAQPGSIFGLNNSSPFSGPSPYPCSLVPTYHSFLNSFSAPSTSIAQPGSIFGPNKSSPFSGPPFSCSTLSTNSSFLNSFSTPSTSVAQPGSLFGPNKSSPFSGLPFSNNSFLNSFSTPSTSVAQPGSIFGPNESSVFSGPPFSSSTSTNNSFFNSFSTPSTSVAQPVLIFEPNKPSPFSGPSTSGLFTTPFPPPFSISSTANSFLNNSFFAPSTSVSAPTPAAPLFTSNFTSSAGATSLFVPNVFSSESSFAPSASICSTSVTAPATASIPSQFPPTTYTIPPSASSSMPSVIQNVEFVKPSPITSPFGPPSVVPQVTAGGPKPYGISSIPVSERPLPLRSSSMLTIRHLSYHRQKSLPTPRYNPKGNGPKVAFFDDAQKTTNTAKTEDYILPRDNPRAFIVGGTSKEWTLRANFNNLSFDKHVSINWYGNVAVSEDVSAPVMDGSLYQDKDGDSGETSAAECSFKITYTNDDHHTKKEDSSNVYELMPKLKHKDYFMAPQAEDLAIKENSEPGFCSRVKDLVVGRYGYGSIKFLAEIDVRQLDLESYIEFRDREVIVYKDESKKPPVGEGLNKPAEITLLNIKCIDKATGKQYITGPKVEKYREMLMKKAAEQGADFMSFDPVQGEWKFRVQHF